jgi:Domain of unknown function (DUF4190)/Protein of unknown function (DUF2510)
VTAPGWYPDPSRPGSLRWWDGTQWSEHRAAMPQPVYGGGTDGYAIASLITGIVGVPIVPLVLGVIARNRIRESGGLKEGNGLAIAGIILGSIQIVIFVVVFLVIFGVAVSES